MLLRISLSTEFKREIKMVSFEASSNFVQQEHDFSPSHKITITNDLDSYTYWYVKDLITSRPFDEMKRPRPCEANVRERSGIQNWGV